MNERNLAELTNLNWADQRLNEAVFRGRAEALSGGRKIFNISVLHFSS
jgi:hypothetical protein